MKIKTVIMAGGYGTRLRPLTSTIPKPMVPVANVPMMVHVIMLLKKYGCTDIRCMLYYQPESIVKFFNDGSHFGVNIQYYTPASDLGTAGSVKFADDGQKDIILVISGDVLTDFNLQDAIRFHTEKKALATMVLTRVPDPLAYGVVITDQAGKIQRFLEKPSWGEVFSDTINTGIYLLHPRALEYVPPQKSFDFSKDLFPLLLQHKETLYGYIAQGYWKDVGNLAEYRLAHYDILDGKIKLDVFNSETMEKDFIAQSARIDPTAVFEGPSIIGESSIIGKNVKLSRCIIGKNVAIETGADLFGCILWDDVRIGKEAQLKESVVGKGTVIKDRAVVRVGGIIGEGCTIGENAVIRANVKIWPFKKVDDGAIVSTSMIWGDVWARSLFGERGISGLSNVEITPEFASKVGAAYGAYLGKNAYVITSRDAHHASRMIKRAMIAGLLSTGVKVGDMRTAPIPVVRYEIGKEGESGGIHVRQNPHDWRYMEIKFFKPTGADMDVSQEKAIEQLFLREDFLRADVSEVGEIVAPSRAQEYYKSGFLKTVNIDALKKSNFKVVLDYAFSSASLIFPGILGELGIEVTAVNSFINPEKVTKTFADIQQSLRRLSHIVPTLNADIGFLFDTAAERIYLVDDHGKILTGDYALILIADLAMRCHPKGTLTIPVNASDKIVRRAHRLKHTVEFTGLSSRSLYAAAHAGNKIFVGDGRGGYMFPAFQPAQDAMYAMVKILEMLAQTKMKLSQLERKIPHSKVSRTRVPCPWDKKGQVMRRAIEEHHGKHAILIDGIKLIKKNGWVLLQPDSQEACFNIWTEFASHQQAAFWIKHYRKYILKLQE